MRKSKLILFLFLVSTHLAFAQKIELQALNVENKSDIRGLDMANEKVIWLSGTKGTVARSVDGGQTWEWLKVKGYEQVDFRDIQAFSAQKAVVMGIGSPAYLLATNDGGKTWVLNYENKAKDIFLDGMDFWDEKIGIAFGDPILNKMQLLRTKDGGQSWTDISTNLKYKMKEGEAGFAASGTGIKTLGKGKVWIATGGSVSNIYFSADYGDTWQRFNCPIAQGSSSKGAFSIDFYNAKRGVVVGGDYQNDKDANNNLWLTNNGGKTWYAPKVNVHGYRSSICYVGSKTMLATGTSGTDISKDGGKTWQNISLLSFNVVASYNNTIILAGARGQLFKLLF